MRILFINELCGSGSHGKIAAEQAQKFESEGHEVKIAYGRHPNVPEQYKKYAVRIGSKLDVYIHALMTRLTDKHGFFSKQATKKFLQWADNYNPDFLWLHNIHGYYINVEMLFYWIKSRPKMKIYWTLHDCWSFTGHCAYFTFEKCYKWRTHCSKCPRINKYPASFIDNSYKNFDRKKNLFTGVNDMTLITPSKWLADLVKESFLKEYPVEVCYNTIDKNIFKPTAGNFREKYNIGNKKIILGVASIWEERKGLDDFIKLSEMLDAEKFVIVLVGLKPKQIKKLPKKIIAIQRTNNQKELAEIYTAADVFFNPTYEDNLPTVNLEAEACGTPVITYDTGGCPETVKLENSKIISCGDVETAKNLIEK